jgi:hypothetical protein
MRKFIGRIKRITITEWLLIGTVILLIFLIINRWDWIWNEMSSSFSKLFKK